MDDAVSYAFACKWENKSYPSIILGVIPKLLPVLPVLLEMPHLGRRAAEVGLKRAAPFMQLLGLWPSAGPNAPTSKGQ